MHYTCINQAHTQTQRHTHTHTQTHTHTYISSVCVCVCVCTLLAKLPMTAPTMVVGSIIKISDQSSRGRSAEGCLCRTAWRVLAMLPPYLSMCVCVLKFSCVCVCVCVYASLLSRQSITLPTKMVTLDKGIARRGEKPVTRMKRGTKIPPPVCVCVFFL
jgi:hypothetical protein